MKAGQRKDTLHNLAPALTIEQLVRTPSMAKSFNRQPVSKVLAFDDR